MRRAQPAPLPSRTITTLPSRPITTVEIPPSVPAVLVWLLMRPAGWWPGSWTVTPGIPPGFRDLAHIRDDNVCRPPDSPHLSHRYHWPLPSLGGTGVVCPYPRLAGVVCPSPRYPAGTTAATITFCTLEPDSAGFGHDPAWPFPGLLRRGWRDC